MGSDVESFSDSDLHASAMLHVSSPRGPSAHAHTIPASSLPPQPTKCALPRRTPRYGDNQAMFWFTMGFMSACMGAVQQQNSSTEATSTQCVSASTQTTEHTLRVRCTSIGTQTDIEDKASTASFSIQTDDVASTTVSSSTQTEIEGITNTAEAPVGVTTAAPTTDGGITGSVAGSDEQATGVSHASVSQGTGSLLTDASAQIERPKLSKAELRFLTDYAVEVVKTEGLTLDEAMEEVQSCRRAWCTANMTYSAWAAVQP